MLAPVLFSTTPKNFYKGLVNAATLSKALYRLDVHCMSIKYSKSHELCAL